jgi:drug/metabolite transporter (DMT)-like permease
MPASTDDRIRQLSWLAAGLAALASLAFAFASPAHVEDGWEYRGFFLVAALVQMGIAVLLAVRSMRREPLTPADLRITHGAAIIGAIVAAASVVVYVVTYVTGIQHQGHSEEAVAAGPALLDLVTKAAEAVLVVVLVRLAVLTSPEENSEEAGAEA